MFDLSDAKRQILQYLTSVQAVVFTATLSQLNEFDPVLTTSERMKFDRVRVPQQRRLHGLGRGLVRYFLDLPRHDFMMGTNGKPMWPEACFFNISHSGDTIAIALHRQREIGIDIETPSRDLHDTALIARVCHPQEAQWIARHKPREFLRCWVRKEAALKAWGTGLVNELQEINTHLQDPFAVVQGTRDLRLWDFPKEFCSDFGALATDKEVCSVAYVSPKGKIVQKWPTMWPAPIECAKNRGGQP